MNSAKISLSRSSGLLLKIPMTILIPPLLNESKPVYLLQCYPLPARSNAPNFSQHHLSFISSDIHICPQSQPQSHSKPL